MKSLKKVINIVFLGLLIISMQFCFFVVQPDANTKSKLKSPNFSEIEQEIFEYQNLARTNPKAVARDIRKLLPYVQNKIFRVPGSIAIRTREGRSAFIEAVRYLESVSPVPALKASRGMSLGARDHVRNEGPRGRTGHTGADGSTPFKRVNRYGRWLRTAGENLAYGVNTAKLVVIGLIVDDGVPSRGHRKNIFNKDFQVTGISFGRHRGFGYMCTITYAGGYIDR